MIRACMLSLYNADKKATPSLFVPELFDDALSKNKLVVSRRSHTHTADPRLLAPSTLTAAEQSDFCSVYLYFLSIRLSSAFLFF